MLCPSCEVIHFPDIGTKESASSVKLGTAESVKASTTAESPRSLPCSVCSGNCTGYLSCDICSGIYDQNCSLLPKEIFETLLSIVQHTSCSIVTMHIVSQYWMIFWHHWQGVSHLGAGTLSKFQARCNLGT